MIEKIKNKAKELLKNKQIELCIGYRRASGGILAMPAFIDKEEDAGLLIWDEYCVYNLANYLKEFPDKKIGVVAKGCDIKAINVLLQESQIKRENLYIIAVECPGVIDEKRLSSTGTEAQKICFAQKCIGCKVFTPELYDILITDEKGTKKGPPETGKDEYESVRKLEAKSIEERLKLWREEFSRCIRCYACRQVCPMCYCTKCVADQDMPVWFSKATSLEANFTWNITRAMHLAARCIDCGECERACPVGIPLRDINKKIEKDIKEMFKYEAGLNAQQKSLLSCFDKNDPGDFIK